MRIGRQTGDEMANEEIAELRYSFSRLGIRCDALEERVASLERGKVAERPEVVPPPPPTVVPPPVIPQARPPKPVAELWSPRPPRTSSPQPPPLRQVPVDAVAPDVAPPAKPRATAADAEYRIGAVVLPRIGAALVLIAIGTFVSMAISKGWIGEWGQFWLAVAACLGFVGVGLWKRNEQEEFGQLLVGVGSCGLYLAFTAGHVFLHRYSGETLVGLFLGLSLANLAYSYATSSRSFLAIGLIGGLTAAVMPMRDDHLTLNAVLHFLILVPCALIVMKNRWSGIAMWLWLFASAALVPAMLHAGDWQGRVAMLYGTALICAGAYSFAGEASFDPQGAFGPFAMLSAALVGMFWVRGGHWGATHVCVLAGAGCLLSLALRPRTATAGRLLFASVAVAFTVAPWGFVHWQASFILLGLSLLCSVGSVRAAGKSVVALSWVLFLLAVLAYLLCLGLGESAVGLPAGWKVEGALLALMIVAAATGGWSLNRIHSSPEWIALGASLLVIPVFTRLAYVALALSPAGFGLYPSLLLGWMLFSFAVNVLVARSKWVHPLAASWITLLLGLAFYIPLASVQPLGEGQDAFLILGLIATTLSTTYVSRAFSTSGNTEDLAVLGALLVLPLVSRLAWVLLTPAGIPGLAALIMAWMAYSLILSALTAWKRWRSLCGIAWWSFSVPWRPTCRWWIRLLCPRSPTSRSSSV